MLKTTTISKAHVGSQISPREQTVTVKTTLSVTSSAELLCCWILINQLACGPGWPQQHMHHPLSPISSQCVQNILCLGCAQMPLLCDHFCTCKSFYWCFKLPVCSLVSSAAGDAWEGAWDWQVLLSGNEWTHLQYTINVSDLECAQQELRRELSQTVHNSHLENSCNCWPTALLGNWPVHQPIISSQWSSWASLAFNDSVCWVSPDNQVTTAAVTVGQTWISS